MARALIVGCGCRGRLLGARLLEQGWEVRGTSREELGLEPIRAIGIEPALADPAKPGTLLELVGDVTVLVWLLGSAHGSEDELEALHGSALERLLERLVETPVRRFVYEAAGSLEPALLAGGRGVVEAAARTWQIPVTPLLSEPQDSSTAAGSFEAWLESAVDSVAETARGAEETKGLSSDGN